ncbi:MAG: sugar ABC transporter permease [Micromonosporaceae bacterium]|jgi:N,N'-diacetylchitobiose transport system permease protein
MSAVQAAPPVDTGTPVRRSFPARLWDGTGGRIRRGPRSGRRGGVWQAVRRGPALLLVPGLTVIALITGWPLVRLVVMSFQEFGRAQIFGAPPRFVGFDNYTRVLTDGYFWVVLGRSLLLCAACVVATMGLGVAVAVLMTRLNRVTRGLVSVGLLLAWAMPPLSATTIWGWLFDTRRGLINYLITQLTGADFIGHSWLNNPVSFYAVATVVITWQSVPFVAFTTYAALTQVPKDVLEAASLDGASGWQRFRRIVVPHVRAVLVVLLVLQIIWDMRVFVQIYTLQTIGGIREQTNTIGVYIYVVSTAGGDLGAGGAIAVLLVIIMLAMSGFYVRTVLREEGI